MLSRASFSLISLLLTPILLKISNGLLLPSVRFAQCNFFYIEVREKETDFFLYITEYLQANLSTGECLYVSLFQVAGEMGWTNPSQNMHAFYIYTVYEDGHMGKKYRSAQNECPCYAQN